MSESPSGGSLHQRRQIFLHQEGPVLIEQSKEGGSSRSTLEPEEDWSGVRIKLEQWWISIWRYKTFFAWILENLSIQYTALGFEPTPFRPWVFPLTTRPGQVFTASVFGNHSTRLLPLPERTRRTGLSRTWRSRQSGSRSSFRFSPSVRGTPDERKPISAPSWCSRLESSE